MNIIKLLNDYKIPFRTHGNQISQGWLGIEVCPFCGKSSYGFGIHIETARCNCWKCGGKSLIDFLKAIIGVDYHTAKEIIENYSQRSSKNAFIANQNDSKQHKTICEYASDTKEMVERHKRYLEGRNYDPDKLEKEWQLKGTENLGDYKFRIVAPIFFKSKLVSYTCRDITGKSELKWKTCKAENEVIPHKNILYGLDNCKKDSCLVVEGPGDVWRMGYNAVSTFGISFKLEQVLLLAERFKRIYILFDAEEQAQKQAHEMAVLLNARRIEVEILELEEGDCNDPGDLPQDEADHIMKDLHLN